MDTPDALGLLLRVAGSLAAVVGLVWMVRRGMLRSGGSRARAAVGSISVLARQQLSGRASVVLVQVGGTGLVLGVTDTSVAVLAQHPVDELLLRPAEPAEPGRRPAATRPLRTARREPVALPATVPADMPEVGTAPAAPPSAAVPVQRRAVEPAVPVQGASVPARTVEEASEVGAPAGAPAGALAGSALSPATWAQALDVVRGRTARR